MTRCKMANGDILFKILTKDLNDSFTYAGVDINITHKIEHIYKVIFDLCNAIELELPEDYSERIITKYNKIKCANM